MYWCNHPSCIEFAQTDDPTCKNLHKFKCPKHEEEAKARGERTEREEVKPEYSDADRLHYARQQIALREQKRLARLADQKRAPSPAPTPPPSQRPPQEVPAAAVRLPEPPAIPQPGEIRMREIKKVEEVDQAGKVINAFGSSQVAADAAGVTITGIQLAMNQKRACNGRLFRYEGSTHIPVARKPKGGAGGRRRGAKTRKLPAPPPPRPSSSPPLAARAITAAAPMMVLPNSANLGDEGILAPLAQGIVNLAMRNGGIQNLNLSLQAAGVDVQISVASFKCSITPVEGVESK